MLELSTIRGAAIFSSHSPIDVREQCDHNKTSTRKNEIANVKSDSMYPLVRSAGGGGFLKANQMKSTLQKNDAIYSGPRTQLRVTVVRPTRMKLLGFFTVELFILKADLSYAMVVLVNRRDKCVA